MAVYSSLVGNLKDLSMFNKVNKARVMVESGMIKLNYIDGYLLLISGLDLEKSQSLINSKEDEGIMSLFFVVQ